MKRFIYAVFVLAACQLSAQTSYTWTNGGGTNIFSDPLNWNPNGLPGAIDDVIFDAGSANCDLDQVSNDVNNFSINAGYSGNITNTGGNAINIGGTFSQAAGSFDAGAGIAAISGAGSLTGGTFNAGSGTLDFISSFTISGGTFNGGSSVVTFNSSYTQSNGVFNASVPNLNLNSTFAQSGGTFNGLTSSIYLASTFNLSGGTFNSTSNDFTIDGGTISRTAGTFAHNSGTVNIDVATTTNLSGAFTFNYLAIFPTGGSSAQRTMNFSASAATSTIQLNPGIRPFRYLGTLSVTRKLEIATASNATNPVGNTGTFNLNGANATISSAVAAGLSKLGNITINTAGTHDMSGVISITGTWLNTNCGTYSAGTSTVNFYSGTITGGSGATTRANFDNLIIQSGTVSISGSSQVNVNAVLNNNSVLNTNTSLIRLTGTGIQSIGGSAASTTINALQVTNAGAKTINSAIVITDSVKVTTGTINSGGNMRLRSTAAKKARIAEITGGGSVSGSVVIENYFPGGTTGWANLCSPGLSGQDMGDWNSNFAIVCGGCPTQSVGGAAFESVYSYNEVLGAGQASASAHYVPISGLGDPIDESTGYWVYLGNNYPSTSDITAVMTGVINSGNSFGGYNLTLTGAAGSENGWNLISNPYPSPIRLSRMFAGITANIDNSILVWNADLNGGNGDWATYSLGGASDIIPMGQGFMVRVLSGSPLAISGSEGWKVTSNVSVQKTNAAPWDINNLFKLNLTGGGQGFDTYTYFDFSNQYNMGFDNGRDIYSLDNASGNMVAQIFSKVNNERYMCGAFPMMAQGGYSTFPIHVPTGYTGLYTIAGINPQPGFCYELIDLNNNAVQDLYLGAYTATIGANNGSNARFNLKVSDCGAAAPVAIHENQNNNGQVYIARNSNGVAVNFNFDQTTRSTISVCNILGQKLSDDIKVNSTKETVYLNLPEKNQVIFVTVTTENGNKVTKKLVY